MARSGGTLISKCIGCMDGIDLLSEVHPFVTSGQFNPITQAQTWFGIDVQAKLRALQIKQGITWVDGIELIHEWVAERKETLVIRDWTHLDYTGVPWVQPTYKLSTSEALAQRFEVRQATTVRHPIDQWYSLKELALVAEQLTVADYLRGYRAFAEKAVEIGFVRYEDFTEAPTQSLQKLCEMLQIPFDSTYTDKWYAFTNITGDVPDLAPGRGNVLREIKPLERRVAEPRTLERFRASPDFEPSLELLGYEL
jgi:hypothetical protein